MEVLPLLSGNEVALQFIGVDENGVALEPKLLQQVELEEQEGPCLANYITMSALHGVLLIRTLEQ